MNAEDFRLAELDRAGTPIRVGLIGAGVTARMIALHLLTPVRGVRLAAVANRTLERAKAAFGNREVVVAHSCTELETCVADARACVTTDASHVCAATNIDVIVEVTGTVEFGARVVLDAIRHRKHVVLVNAELDSTLGPVLKTYADRAGVVITNTDGDEPGVALTLLRYLRGIGLAPVAAGNFKGMIDHYRTPHTQREFAARHAQDPAKVTSFADGTKLAMECALIANATGFRAGRRGMFGPACAHVRELPRRLPLDLMLQHGLVDYALGAEPHTGAFVLVYEENARKRQELAYYKMGDGPVYAFYTPFHLPHLQVVSTIARACLSRDATVAPIDGPVCEVATIAKRDLNEGDKLDGVGGFAAYGLIENAGPFAAQNLLPMGLSEGCVLRRAVPKDQPLTYDDVIVPEGRLGDALRREQVVSFAAR